MEILVTGVNKNCQEIEISFSSTIGNGRTIWLSPEPKVGEKYVVELEVPGTFTWGKEIIMHDETFGSIEQTDEGIIITGTLQDTADDGCAVVNVGSSIIILETEGSPFQPNVGVRLKISRLILFDVKI